MLQVTLISWLLCTVHDIGDEAVQDTHGARDDRTERGDHEGDDHEMNDHERGVHEMGEHSLGILGRQGQVHTNPHPGNTHCTEWASDFVDYPTS